LPRPKCFGSVLEVEGNSSKKEVNMSTNEPVFENGLLRIGDKYYCSDMVDGRTVLKQVSNKEVVSINKKVGAIAKELAASLNREAVLREAIRSMSKPDILRLHKMLFESKKKYKPKTRADHCVDMKIGNFTLPIIE
jgi:hypothetical protein